MRALFAANTAADPNQGAPGADLATIAALRALGHEVEEIWQPGSRHLRHGNLHQWLELPRAYAIAIESRWRSNDYDVVQVNQPHAFLAARRHQATGRRALFINRSHGWEPRVHEAFVRLGLSMGPRRSWWREWAAATLWRRLARHNELVLRWSDGLVVCSVEDRDYVVARHGFPVERVLALTPGVATDYIATPARPMDDARLRRLLYVGQVAPHKAPDVVARVAGQILRQCQGTTLTWVCPREHHPHLSFRFEREVLPAVTFLDWMPRDRLRPVYDSHGILLLPSRFEGFSLTLLEAMARGLCVVATAVGGAPQVVVPGVTGFLSDTEDVSAMVGYVLALLQRPLLAETISTSARSATEGLTWERAALELVSFWEHLLALKKSSGVPPTARRP